MNVLADTSVWSLALRRKKTAQFTADERHLTRLLSEAIEDGRVKMIGPIRQELLSGIKEARQFEALRHDLEAFRDEPIATEDYEAAARWYNVFRAQGVECGPVDILICAVAIRRGWDMLTRDAAMARCLSIMRPARSPLAKAHRQSE